MGLLMVEKQEPAGTCPSFRLTLLYRPPYFFFPLSWAFSFSIFSIFFLGWGQPRLPLFSASLGVRLFKLRLRQPRELGDRAFLKVFQPRRKALDDSPSCNSKRNIGQMQFLKVFVICAMLSCPDLPRP